MAAKLVYKYAEVGGEAGTTYEFTEQRLQINLFYISQKFYDCLGRLKLSKNLTLFIDGIDIRPSQIPYEDYLDCIKGLANACWVLNTELFANVRDSKGHLKVVLLLRPDIFNSLSLQNATTKLDDNFVYLSDAFQNAYSEYFLGSLKDQLSFYYSENDYRHFIKFFDFFQEPDFIFNEYQTAYDKFVDYICNNATDIPKFVEDPKSFLQLLYDCNVIAAIENEGKYFHFSYREKSDTNITPEVIYYESISYRFHYGLYKKARIGRYR